MTKITQNASSFDHQYLILAKERKYPSNTAGKDEDKKPVQGQKQNTKHSVSCYFYKLVEKKFFILLEGKHGG